MGKEVALLFAGQGAQAVGMGKELAETYPSAKALFQQADDLLGFSLTDAMFNGPMEELTRTSRCQPALYTHGLACLQILKEQVPDLEVLGAAGLSLGEFTAHGAAGTFDFETGLRLVAQRGLFMEEATDATEGTMAAMMGGEEQDVRELAKACDVDVANFNAPGQIVISGSKAGVAQALERAKEFKVKLGKELPVAGAYHSRLMESAQKKLEPELEKAELKTPGYPVICNVDATEVSEPGEIRSTLARQVTGSVRWEESIRKLLDKGCTTFLELGPGGILAGLMRRIEKSATVLRAEDPATIEAAVEALKA